MLNFLRADPRSDDNPPEGAAWAPQGWAMGRDLCLRRWLLILCACPAALLFFACGGGDGGAGQAASTVTASPAPAGSLRVVPSPSGLYHAAFPDFGSTEDQVSLARIQEFERLAGKRLAWVYFSNNWGSGIRFPAAAVRDIRTYGAVPFVRLMPRSGFDERREPVFTLDRIANGDFDGDLRQWARDARDSGGPLMMEFGTEVNGDWFPWNGRWNSGAAGPSKFQAAYRHIVDLFRSESVTNVTWVFHVDAQASPQASWNTMRNYYPGDDYVDWVGLSVYGAQRPDEDWQSFEEVLAPAYRELTALAPGKPLAVLEFGVTDEYRGRDKGQWIAEAFAAATSGRYPQIRALTYWHETFTGVGGVVSRLRVDSSAGALASYRQAVSSPSLLESAIVSNP